MAVNNFCGVSMTVIQPFLHYTKAVARRCSVRKHSHQKRKFFPFLVTMEERCSQKVRKIHRKNLCRSLVFNKVAGLRPATLLRKRLWRKCFLMNLEKFLRTSFLREHLRTTAFNDNIDNKMIQQKDHTYLLQKNKTTKKTLKIPEHFTIVRQFNICKIKGNIQIIKQTS